MVPPSARTAPRSAPVPRLSGRSARRAAPPPAPDEAAPGGAIAAALADAAIAVGDALGRTEPAAAVHGLRRALKRTRALLNLVEGHRRPAARQLRRELAAAARSLAQARDTHILGDALADLADHGAADLPSAEVIAAGAADGHARDAAAALDRLAAADLPARIAGAARDLDAEDRALPRLLAKGYARARRAAGGLDPDDAAGLHELRKHVVAHHYQMALALPWWRRFGKFWRTELDRLRDTLGRHHDLEILIDRLGHTQQGETDASDAPRTNAGGSGLTPEAAAAIMAAAHARQRALGAKALRRHARLFAERPRAFRRRLKAYRRSRT